MHERRFDPSRADRLDNPERRKWLPPDAVLVQLRLRKTDIVADIGAGTGYFTFPMAEKVSGGGRVEAVDVSPEMLARLQAKVADTGVKNVRCWEGEAASTGLPGACCDRVFMANVWHEFDDHAAVLAETRRLLKPRGRVAILDWRPDVEPDHGPPLAHRIAATSASASLQSAGFAVSDAMNVGLYAWLVVGSNEEASPQ